MVSTRRDLPSVPLPGYAYVGATAVVAALLFAASVLRANAPLLGLFASSFVVLVAVVAWLAYQVGAPDWLDPRPVTAVLAFVPLLLLYAVLIAEAVLLGLLASFSLLLAALAVGVLLALSARPAPR